MAQLQRDKSENQMICELFDSFVKSALRNKSRTLARDYLRTAKYEQPVWDIECYDHEGRSEEYRVEAGYEIKIQDFVCTVYSEQLYQAFLTLDEKILIVLILQYQYPVRFASPTKYASMVSAQRDMTLAGYEVYRFGGSEFSPAEQAEIMIKRFFQDLFEKHGLSIF